MCSTPEQEPSNPIGSKYADVMRDQMVGLLGETVTPELISGLADQLLSTTCTFVGTTEVAADLGISTQRVRQLVDKMPTPAIDRSYGSFWLADQLDEFKAEHQKRRDENLENLRKRRAPPE